MATQITSNNRLCHKCLELHALKVSHDILEVGMRITAPTISPMVVFFGYDSQVEISSKWGKAVKVPKRYQTTKLDLRGI